MNYEYKTRGTCSRKILFSVEDNKVKNVFFDGGCNGNGKGIAALVEGSAGGRQQTQGNYLRDEAHFLPGPAGYRLRRVLAAVKWMMNRRRSGFGAAAKTIPV